MALNDSSLKEIKKNVQKSIRNTETALKAVVSKLSYIETVNTIREQENDYLKDVSIDCFFEDFCDISNDVVDLELEKTKLETRLKKLKTLDDTLNRFPNNRFSIS